MAPPNKPIDVFKFIDMHDGDKTVCWEWIGGLGGRKNDKRPYFQLRGQKILAYRLVYDLFHGATAPLTEGLVVRHKCDNPVCCNPYHLERGTQKQNEHDKHRRNRSGALPNAAVARIRAMWNARDSRGNRTFTQAELGRMFGVARETITSIINNRRHNVDYSQDE